MLNSTTSWLHHFQNRLQLVVPLLLLFLLSGSNTSFAWDDRELLINNGREDFLLMVRSIDSGVYISLPELASATGCSYYQAAPYHYLHFNGHPIRLMVGSFFFDRGGEVCQLAAAPLLEAGELFLPLSLLSQLHPPEGDWHYDPLARELLVRQPEGVQGFSIAELPEGVLLRLHLDQVPDYAGDSVNHSGRLVFAKADVPQACLPTVIYHPDISGFRVTTPGDELQVEFDYASTLELLEIFESDDHKRISFLFGSGSALALETELPAWTPPVGWSLDTIIIDPGHGGRDPGAVSPWGMYEKTITLAIGLELERLLKEDGRFQVYMTRSDDRFVSLKDRTRFANQHAGKLFISIHCNAARNRSARGFETFLLRTARNEYALNVALKENAVVRLENAPEQYDAMRTDNYILMSLAQSAFVQESAQFALQLKPHLSPLIRPHSRGISQAGFYVLWGASMPAVLLESGFITNKRDYNLLKSAKGRKQLARALFDSILDFKRQYENN